MPNEPQHKPAQNLKALKTPVLLDRSIWKFLPGTLQRASKKHVFGGLHVYIQSNDWLPWDGVVHLAT